MKKPLLFLLIFLNIQSAVADDLISPEVTTRIANGNFKNQYNKEILDNEIRSPKSVRFSKDGTKFYVNSLEGGKTVVYSWPTLKKLKTISHRFDRRHAALFGNETTVFDYPYFSEPPAGDVNSFMGKPVESELSADGRWLWIPYYRRDWDADAQSPSAVAIIDTKTDKIVRVMQTGPIPKYVVSSPDGKYTAIIHWGDNTIGIIDTSSGDPNQFQYISHLVVERQLDQAPLKDTDRDATCGFCLRGAVFSSDSQYLIIARMGGGGIAGFHVPSKTYLGTITNIAVTPRHLALDLEDNLFVSSNQSGYVSKLPVNVVIDALRKANGRRIAGPRWPSVYVGKGARTLDLSPDGKLVFVAVNESSEMVTLDSNLRVLAKTPVDPYAVGLAVSPDGTAVIVTSQGHSGHGGNSVNIIQLVPLQRLN
jgi:DNA-binding beta-propeller fold protein YncE